jgi:hypothetical protein
MATAGLEVGTVLGWRRKDERRRQRKEERRRRRFRGKKTAAQKNRSGPNFDFLGVQYRILLEMGLFFPSNIFLGVGKHDTFRNKI